MENTTCPTNVLESASVPGLMMLLATLIAGGIVLVICYAVSRRSRSRQDSQKPTFYRNEFVPENSESPMYIPPSTPVTMQPTRESGKRAKNKKRREVQQERDHPWTIGTLKGHTGVVNDMAFSSNGKYVASCADDENLRETRKHVQSAGQYMYKKNESKKKASASLQTTNVRECTESRSSGRREDKETRRASRSRSRGSSRLSSQHGTVSEEPLSHEVLTSDTSSNDDIPDESQWQTMFPSDVPTFLASTINKYTLSQKELLEHGYPVPSSLSPGHAIINNVKYPSGPKIESDSGQYSNSSSSDNSEQESSSDNEKNLDRENRPDKERSSECRNGSGNEKRRDSESGSDNETSSDDKSSSGNEKSCDSESSSDSERSPSDSNSSESWKSCDSGSNSAGEKSPESKKCSEHKRSCNRKDSSSSKNSSDDEMCLDEKRHGNKVRNCNSESSSDSEKSPDKKESGVGGNTGSLKRTCVRCQKTIYVDQSGEYLGAERCVYHWGKQYNRMTNDSWYYTCCNQDGFSRGCAEWKTHVWTGLVPGINGPFANYVRTMPSPVYLHDNNYGVYAMDCEMCYTRRGLELARVTLVNLYGQIVYDTLVKPSSEVIDYNTKFSGITEEDLLNVTKTLREVQNDLLKFIHAETILMGHGLANDLRALRMIHTNVVDTSVMFPHYLGLPYRNGLKTLARRVLNRKIQEETHNSIEDARVVMDLVFRKAQYEWQGTLVW
ncbi:uncharacterized protein LOC112465460 isoform X2 [Temnothorax curvispinosus]|uniref:Uncharacterized protein LOC112465460 isoform X2 n=1 Tax=Temnothorax curvispinosus TaxID=300111 RepID=A0A6J1R2B0_9HYME|nr:uncharacterized protein LOC112465460 isoform X2 [Temnothorax curvispinosus]